MNRARNIRRAAIPAGCKTIGAAYDALARDLALPAHFGRNLDALWDCLTGDVAGPFAIVVEDAGALEKSLGAQGTKLLELLRALAKLRKDATVTIRRKRKP